MIRPEKDMLASLVSVFRQVDVANVARIMVHSEDSFMDPQRIFEEHTLFATHELHMLLRNVSQVPFSPHCRVSDVRLTVSPRVLELSMLSLLVVITVQHASA